MAGLHGGRRLSRLAARRQGTVLPQPGGRDDGRAIVVTGVTIAPGAPVVLFPTRIYGGGVDSVQGRQYDISSDGRFLINTEPDSATAPITLIQNWTPDAKK